MPKKCKSNLDSDNPEWTAEDFAHAKRFHDLPEEMRQKLLGLKDATVKVDVNLRLSPDVLRDLRAIGGDWQEKANDALREYVEKELTARAS